MSYYSSVAAGTDQFLHVHTHTHTDDQTTSPVLGQCQHVAILQQEYRTGRRTCIIIIHTLQFDNVHNDNKITFQTRHYCDIHVHSDTTLERMYRYNKTIDTSKINNNCCSGFTI